MLQAGTASFDITPSTLGPLQGHYSPDAAVGVAAPVEGRALVLDDGGNRFALVTLDVIGVPLDFTHRVRRRVAAATSIAGEGVLIAASHTHSAPATLNCLGHEPDRAWLDSVEDKVVAAVSRAGSHGVEAVLRLGQSSACFNVNRRPLPGRTEMTCNHGAVNDRRVRVLLIQTAAHTPVATLFHYACHPTAKSGSDGWISPDYVGSARQRIETDRGGVAMFLPGCFGNIRPEVLDAEGRFASATPEQMRKLGTELADAVALACERAAPMRGDAIRGGLTGIRFGFGPLPDDVFVSQLKDYTNKPRSMNLHRVIDAIQTHRREGSRPAALRSELQRIDIGDLTLWAVGGEPVLEIGLAIEKALSPRECWAMGYANDMVGYLCTPQQKREGGYEPSAFPYFGHCAPFADEQEGIMHVVRSS